MELEKINFEIKRIASNSPYSYEETKLVLNKFLEEIEDTGELIKLLRIYKAIEGNNKHIPRID